MKRLVILTILLSLIIWSCATKRKTKVVERINQKLENVIKNDSTIKIQSTISKIEASQTFNEFERIVKALNVQYDGEQGNELNVTLNHTEKGTELNVKGKGKASYNEKSKQTNLLTKNDILNIYDSLKKLEINQNKVEQSKFNINQMKMDKKKNENGFQLGAYLTGFAVVCFVILLVWLNNFVRKK